MSAEQAMEEATLLTSLGMSPKAIAAYLAGELSHWQVIRLARKVPGRQPVRALALRDREKTEVAALAMLGMSLSETLQVTGFNADGTFAFLRGQFPSWRLRTCLSCDLPFPSPEVGVRFCPTCRPSALKKRLEAYEPD